MEISAQRVATWYRIDKASGLVELVSGGAVSRAARCYFASAKDVIVAGRFSTPFSIYSSGAELRDDEAVRAPDWRR
jgi:hypothetical protein